MQNSVIAQRRDIELEGLSSKAGVPSSYHGTLSIYPSDTFCCFGACPFFHVMAVSQRRNGNLPSTDPRRPRSRPSIRPYWRTQTADDREQDQVSEEAPRQRHSALRPGQQPRSLRSHALQVDSGLHNALAFILKVKVFRCWKLKRNPPQARQKRHARSRSEQISPSH
jgi:hypothetical protein